MRNQENEGPLEVAEAKNANSFGYFLYLLPEDKSSLSPTVLP